MLAESAILGLNYPSCVYRAIESNDCIYAAMRAERGLAAGLAIDPFSDGDGRELSQAVEAGGYVACEKLLAM